jgi:hypothetical protein
MYRGEGFKGQLLEPTGEVVGEQFYERFTPLFLQDMRDAIKYQGLNGPTMVSSSLAFHGIGAMTYPEAESAKLGSMKNKYAQDFFGETWDNLGPQSQKMLRMQYPAIEEQQKVVQQENLHKKARVRFIEEQRRSERQLRRSLPDGVTDQLDELLVDVGGLSRRVSGNWYLNDKRYLEYQFKVSTRLKEVLPKFLEMNFDQSPQSQMFKAQYIEKIIDSIKKQVRFEITSNANMKDIMRG